MSCFPFAQPLTREPSTVTTKQRSAYLLCSPSWTATSSAWPCCNRALLKGSFSLRRQVFASLDRCEEILGKQRYIAGDILTEADVRLFQTLIRFDPVYVVSCMRLVHACIGTTMHSMCFKVATYQSIS